MTSDDIISLLGLRAHPEGGWYAETFRDGANSAIWFLLRCDERSHWHRVVNAAEIWHHYLGDPLRLDVSVDGTTVTSVVLGTDLAAGERPQAVVPQGAWQTAGAAAAPAAGYTLVGCTVGPPFSFEQFELAPPAWEPGG